MTKDEVAKLIQEGPENLDIDEFLVNLINRAILIERNACAETIEKEVERYDREYKELGLELAEMIRERKD